jgi:hypothetical protein
MEDLAQRDSFETLRQRSGLGAPVGFNVPENHVAPRGAQMLRFLKHAISFADANRGAHVHLERPSLSWRGKKPPIGSFFDGHLTSGLQPAVEVQKID